MIQTHNKEISTQNIRKRLKMIRIFTSSTPISLKPTESHLPSSPLAVNTLKSPQENAQNKALENAPTENGGIARGLTRLLSSRPESLSQVNQVPDLSHFNQVSAGSIQVVKSFW